MLRQVTIVLSVIGLLIGIAAVATGKREIPDAPPRPPGEREPVHQRRGRGRDRGARRPRGRDRGPEPGLVWKCWWASATRSADRLMRLDARSIDSQILRSQGELESPEAEIDRWHAFPRAEDVPPLEAGLEARRAASRRRDKRQRDRRRQVGRRGRRDVAAPRRRSRYGDRRGRPRPMLRWLASRPADGKQILK